VSQNRFCMSVLDHCQAPNQNGIFGMLGHCQAPKQNGIFGTEQWFMDEYTQCYDSGDCNKALPLTRVLCENKCNTGVRCNRSRNSPNVASSSASSAPREYEGAAFEFSTSNPCPSPFQAPSSTKARGEGDTHGIADRRTGRRNGEGTSGGVAALGVIVCFWMLILPFNTWALLRAVLDSVH
jgi:hypothetical protein